MATRTVETSPRLYARIGGLLYLIIIIVGGYGEIFVRGRLIVADDATATAANIRSLESLWRFHIAAELLLLICAVALLLILFVLLRPVSRDLALLAVFFDLVGMGIEAASTLYPLGALVPLGNARYLKAFTPEQLDAMASQSVESFERGFGLSLIFFGCFCLVTGNLIFRSGYLPKALGVLYQIAGLSYLTNSFALVLSPALASQIFPAILLPAFVGEASLCLWLLVIGVNVKRWEEKASAWRVSAAEGA